MGSDYTSFKGQAGAKSCQEDCIRDPKCKAWTYVKPRTFQDAEGRCWLKHSQPARTPNKDCISGKVNRSYGFPMPSIKGNGILSLILTNGGVQKGEVSSHPEVSCLNLTTLYIPQVPIHTPASSKTKLLFRLTKKETFW